MSNNLKREIEKEFNKEKNYNTILYKVERMSVMKKFKIRYAVGAICAVALVGVIGFKSVDFKSEEVANLNINQIENMASSKLDADMRIMELGDLPEKYDFVKNIKVPEELEIKNVYSVYTRKDFNAETYDILRDYVLAYGDDNAKNVTIKFSEEGEPLRDYFLISANQKTIIENVEFEISSYEDMYIATFSHDGVNFDIETRGVTEEELVELLISIIL